MSKPTDLVQGTLDLLVLKTVALQPMHGWAIAQRIRQMSGEVLQVGQGALYPSLHKLEQNGWISRRRLFSVCFHPGPPSHHAWRLAGEWAIGTSSDDPVKTEVCKLTMRYALKTSSHQRSMAVTFVRR